MVYCTGSVSIYRRQLSTIYWYSTQDSTPPRANATETVADFHDYGESLNTEGGIYGQISTTVDISTATIFVLCAPFQALRHVLEKSALKIFPDTVIRLSARFTI